MRGARFVAATLGITIAAGGFTAAQNRPKPGDPPYEPPPFEVPAVSPAAFGARSLAMGRAFVALADDATASITNPAGLAFLTRPQVSFHGRVGTDERDGLLAGGEWATATADEMRARASDDPSFDLPAPLPALATDPRASYEADTLRPAFAAGVLPWRGTTFSVFIEQSSQFDGGGRFELFEPFFADRFRASSALELSLWGVGASAARRVNERLAVGASIRGSRYELAAFESYRLDDWTDHEFESDPPSFSHTDVFVTTTTANDADTLFALSLGAVYEPIENVSVGVALRQGGTVSFDTRIDSLRCTDIPGKGTCTVDDPSTAVVSTRSGRIRAEVPDTLSAGVAWWIDDPLVVALELAIESYGGSGAAPAGAISRRYESRLDRVDEEVRFHLGAEYELGAGRREAPLFLRGGLFSEPHRDASARIDSSRTLVTLGAGIELHRVRVDGALQLGDGASRALISVEYRFR